MKEEGENRRYGLGELCEGVHKAYSLQTTVLEKHHLSRVGLFLAHADYPLPFDSNSETEFTRKDWSKPHMRTVNTSTTQNGPNVLREMTGRSERKLSHPQQSLYDIGGQWFWQNQHCWFPILQCTCFHGNQKTDCFPLHQQPTSCFNVKRQLAEIIFCIVNV